MGVPRRGSAGGAHACWLVGVQRGRDNPLAVEGEALLKAGARREATDNGRRTAVWYAACAGNWRVVAVLLRAGAKVRKQIAARPRRDADSARTSAGDKTLT